MRGSIDMKADPHRTFVNAKISTLLLLLLSTVGCDIVPGVSTSNETVPAGATLLYQGSFIGTGISGTAQIYQSNGLVLLHLEGLSTPTGSTYAIFLENGAPSSPFYSSALKSRRGNQNYSTGLANPGSFSRVAIRENTSPISTEVAAATLLAAFTSVAPTVRLEF
jgi:hypothetical protein